MLFYAENELDAIRDALFNFQQQKDTKAAIIVIMTYSSDQVCLVMEEITLI